jgi:hypothetical protein
VAVCRATAQEKKKKKKPNGRNLFFPCGHSTGFNFTGALPPLFFLSNFEKKKKFNFDCSKHAQRYIYFYSGVQPKVLDHTFVCMLGPICTGNLKYKSPMKDSTIRNGSISPTIFSHFYCCIGVEKKN